MDNNFQLTAQNQEQLEKLFTQYPHKKAITLPLLWIIQYQETWLSPESMQYAAEILDVPYMHIYSVATFYTMFRLTKPPKHTIEVCRTLSCELCGSEEITKQIQERIENCDDIQLIEVECLGACGYAPMCAVNGIYHNNLTTEKVNTIIGDLL
jgi:NADH-quinone oxidoreductase subunit E